MVLSKFHTLRGHEILVITFPDKGETHLVCPPNSIIKRVPLPDLAAWGKPQGEDMKGQPGNGSSRFEIGQADMGGWVRINASGAALPDDLPTFLATRWRIGSVNARSSGSSVWFRLAVTGQR